MWWISKQTLPLQKRIKELETELGEKSGEYSRLLEIVRARNSVSFLLDEAIPKEQTERKKYMADCALFYSVVFKEKLKHFIGLQLEELSQVGRSEKGDDFIRANINCFRLIDEWMEKNTNEHLGNLQNMRNSFQGDKEFINNFKEEYGV